MSITPLISVIVPVYNTENFVLETLTSIHNQDYENLEIIVLNDGSTDNSLEKIISYSQSCDREIRVINKENEGLSRTRNLGVVESNGDYLAFIDSDDVISKDHFSILIDAIKSDGLDGCFSDHELTKEGTRYGSNSSLSSNSSNNILFLDFKTYNKIGKNLHCSAGLYSRVIFDEFIIKFSSNVSIGEDRIFIYELLANNIKMGFYSIKSYKYLIRANSIMTSTSIYRIKEFIKSLNTLQNQSFNRNLFIDDIHKATYSVRVLLGITRTIIRRSRYLEFIEFIKSEEFRGYSSFIMNNLTIYHRGAVQIHLIIRLPLMYFIMVRLAAKIYDK